MRTNKMTDATKVLILVATVIVVCVLCAVGFKMVNEGKSSVNASTNNFNSMTGQYSEVDLAIYDGADVQGSEVVNLIKKTVDAGDKELAIGVQTNKNKSLANHIFYNREAKADSDGVYNLEATKIPGYGDIEEVSKDDYINTSAQFTGKVYKNKNGMIIYIDFKQISK